MVLLIPERSFGCLTGVHVVVGSKLIYLRTQLVLKHSSAARWTTRINFPHLLRENPGREEDQLLIRGVLNVPVTVLLAENYVQADQ